ncbi:TetR/AcrR family transcriptional regulator [Bradyrhizobium genosp. A]|uniref:TetR/AcrR family transcriptional regulator n=1 Tax=Bradyrhizobium genosp. A TaxID=83626 RepID=UPI003CF9E790
MARPRQFDHEAALNEAIKVFWAKGFAGTSTDDLRNAMGLGRQSLYNAFGDKRQLYLEALSAYHRRTITSHINHLNSSSSPLAGIRAMLLGVIAKDRTERELGCMGVAAASEFGTRDPELTELQGKAGAVLQARLVERVGEALASGEIDPLVEAEEGAFFIQMTMNGLQLAARAGAPADMLRAMARFAIDRLQARLAPE